jgi:hypothetical protein
MTINPFAGKWSYRSLLNGSDLSQDLDKLEFGRGTLDIQEVSSTVLGGTIGGPGWLVGGEEWVYDYIGWLAPAWPNSDATLQRNAIAGSVVRTVLHSSGTGGVSPAGVTASFYAVQES